MRILFDQGTPAPLRTHLTDHEVATAFEKGWSHLENGELLAAAENEGFDAFVTTDQNLGYQQNLAERKIAVVVLLTTSWPRIRKNVLPVIEALSGTEPGTYHEVAFPSI